ncbi:MAG: putative phenylacetic acid degradation protein PaaE/phenylacetate-CoA oxygenase/reductase, PaaK [Mycobacterium sp.]|nr:putative phenylacetic acid degradation protein PaaE/phenylacetate-CoA oxygenase/reductase, PaaK [Mycobacterium sp.]
MTTASVAETPASGRGLRNKPFHVLRVAALDRLCDDAVAVTFAVPEDLEPDFAFRPGQSLTLRRTVGGQEHRRSYSVCAALGESPRIGVRAVAGGAVSEWLVNEVSVGDAIEMQPPSGTFAADPATAGRHVLIAAGSGITPILSIAASVLQNPQSQAVLLYGNRRANSVMFAEELADLKDTYGPRLEVVHVLSREPRGVELFSGRLDGERVQRILEALVPVDAVDHFWLCGPYGMVTDAGQVLRGLGVADERIHQELFFVEDVAPPPSEHAEAAASGPTSDVTIILDGATSTLTLPRGTTVLDGAQQSRDDLPFACKGGVCGTCRAKVTSGTVEMQRNYALEKAEVERGFVLTCQSLPTSDTVTVDFDA